MTHRRKISVVGLGYVGLPVAVAFGAKQLTVGFDISEKRIEELRCKHDRTGELGAEELEKSEVLYTNDPVDIAQADFHIVAVPTPIDEACKPDLSALISASRLVGEQLKKGDIVVFESTVYPGATEEICQVELENSSGLRAGTDFCIGYSPERINPGDKEHTLTKITKVVSGQDEATLQARHLCGCGGPGAGCWVQTCHAHRIGYWSVCHMV